MGLAEDRLLQQVSSQPEAIECSWHLRALSEITSACIEASKALQSFSYVSLSICAKSIV